MILEQAIAGEAKKIVSEFRILQINFMQLVVGNRQHFAILDAFDRLRPVVVR